MLQFQLPDLHLQFYHLHGAKRKPTFIAIGLNKATLIVKLSPGITISTPSGKVITLLLRQLYVRKTVDGSYYEMEYDDHLFFKI
jgi:hypothetical protein